MTEKVVTAKPNTSVGDAREMLLSYHVSGLPVVDDEGRVVGVVSERDLIAREGHTVAEVMTSPPITVSADTSVATVASVLAANAINRVPVLNEEHLVGIISRADILRYVAARVRFWEDGESSS